MSNSIVEYRPSLIGYLVTLLAMLLFGIIGFVFLPILVNLTKTAIHRCAKCLNEVKTNSYFGYSSMEDKLVTFQLGNAGVILTRRLLLYLAMVLFLALGIYSIVLVEGSRDHESAPITSSLTWAVFSTEVGHTAWMKNRRKAEATFIEKYLNKGV